MFARIFICVALLLSAAAIPATGEDLVPAGSIDDAVRGQNRLIVVQDDPVIRSRAELLQKRFFGDALLIDDNGAVEESLAGQTVIIFGTPAHAWLQKYKERLPLRYENGAVVVEGERFEGAHLRVICAIRNPQDRKHRALLYTAANPEEIPVPSPNSVWPFEWVVADGSRTLATRWFAGPRLSVEHMTADLDELVSRIGSVHPAAVDGLPPELTNAVMRAREELTEPLRRRGFWLVLNSVLCALGDAHSSVDLPPSGEELNLPLVWTGEGLFISTDAGPLRKGDRVVRLGTQTEPQLLERLRGVIPAENDHWIRHRGESFLRDLGLLRTLKIAAGAPVPVIVERDGEQHEVGVPLAAVGRSAKKKPWIRFEIDEQHNLGVLVLDRCINNELYRTTLERFFGEVREKNITRIAVDVRRNGGGNSSVVDELLRYLNIESYTKFGSLIRWSPEVRAARARQGNLRALFKTGNQRHPQPRVPNRRVEQPFRGRVFILTSKATFSSGNWFAVIFQDNRIGKVVGEPTGNGPSRPGDLLRFTLTHSGLSYGLSHKYWYRPDPRRDPADTLLPDHPVATTRRDLIDGRDPVLEFLYEMD